MNVFKTIILFLFIFIFCGCAKFLNQDKINYIQVSNYSKNSYKNFYGIIKSQSSSDLSFQTEGKIIYLPYTKGDFVKKGEVLARLDGALYKIKKQEEQARLSETIVQYNKNKSYYERMDVLHKEGAISDNDWEEAYFALKSLDSQIKVQKEKINYLEKEISYNIITAPFDGYIADKMSDVGNFAKIGVPILTVISNKKTQVEAFVDSSFVNEIKINDEVVVENQEEKYNGKITHISETSLKAGGYLVKIELDNLFKNLKEGMSVVVFFPLKNSFVFQIPLNCIFEEKGEFFVYKIINIKNHFGKIQKAKVKLGGIDNQNIEVLEGINKNDILLSDNLNKVKTNAKVKL